MAISNLEVPVRQIFWGNILFTVCCGFYLAWWLLAFCPSGARGGLKSGWLLIPTLLTGVAALALSITGMREAARIAPCLPVSYILWGGIIAYLILIVATTALLKRPVTAELILIVGWTMLALSEVNILHGSGLLSFRTSFILASVIGLAALISLACYVLYYHLGSWAGYIDGMIPLLLAALVMAGICISMTA